MHTVEAQFTVSEKVQVFLEIHVDVKDELRAIDTGIRVGEFLQWAMGRHDLRTQYALINPPGYEITTLEEYEKKDD